MMIKMTIGITEQKKIDEGEKDISEQVIINCFFHFMMSNENEDESEKESSEAGGRWYRTTADSTV
jgi:hypothetical protein